MTPTNSKTKVTPILDKRSYSHIQNGHPIRIELYHKGKQKPIKTGYFCETEHWIYGNSDNEEVKKAIENGNVIYVSSKNPNARRINKTLDLKLDCIDQFLTKNDGEIVNYSPDDLKRALVKVADELNSNVHLKSLLKKNSTLTEAFEAVIQKKHEAEDWGTKKTYSQTLKTYKDYFAHLGIEDIPLIEINKKWADNFDNWFSKKPGRGSDTVKASTREKKLGQLFTIMEDICDDEDELMGWNDYKFRKYKLPKNKAPKRSIDFKKLDFDELSKKFDMSKVANLMDLIRQLKLVKDSKRWHYRNMLLFIWDCRGMDLIDMAFLTRQHIYNKTVEYGRTKKEVTDVRILDLNEEALEILELYNYKDMRPDELIFPYIKDIYDEKQGKTEEIYDKYKDRVRYFNTAITKMLESIGLDKATSKMIRHTWAQDGYRKFENRDLISEGLLHNSVQTSKIYARDLDRERINEVNNAITERKSSITTITSELQIDLFQYFHRGKAWSVEIDEFRSRVLKKINTYTDKVTEILTASQFKTWTRLLDKFSEAAFESYDAVEDWINSNLKSKFEEKMGLRIITSDYNL